MRVGRARARASVTGIAQIGHGRRAGTDGMLQHRIGLDGFLLSAPPCVTGRPKRGRVPVGRDSGECASVEEGSAVMAKARRLSCKTVEAA